MKKNWIYMVLVIILVAGGVYLILENKDIKAPDVANDDSQEQVDNEKPETPKEAEEDKPKDDVFVQPPEDDTPSEVPEVGRTLPDFTLKNLDGKDVTLSDLEGKITLINFWATWCKYCDEEMPDLQKLREENDDILVLAVNVNEPKSKAEEYVRKGGYDFEVLLDEGGKIAANYLVTGMPASYFMDEDGKFIGRVQGLLTYEQMNEILSDIKGQ